jgi:hypothetical protein
VKEMSLREKDEAELVRGLVSKATDARFEAVQPPPDHPLPIQNLAWFIRCRKLEDIEKTRYLNTVWKERDGPIWLESLAVGDTMGWIESAYGQESAISSLDLDYSQFPSKEFQTEFKVKFPSVCERIAAYEEIAARVSKKRGVQIELRPNGSKGIVVFTLAAKIQARDQGALSEEILTNVEALKDVFAETMHP